MPAPSQDSLFVEVTSRTFKRELIADIAAGKAAALRVPNAMPESICHALIDRLQQIDLDTYDARRVYPKVGKFGPAINDYCRAEGVSEEYWKDVERSRKIWESLAFNPDPFAICRQLLGAEWPRNVVVGRREPLEMSPGIIREINSGLQVHFDDAAREQTSRVLDANLVAQFAFNLYLRVPSEGGELVLWRHRWQPSDETLRVQGGYGYQESVVKGDQQLIMKPDAGEAILFDPRNYHTVRPCKSGRRISLGFFVGLSDDGELVAWS